MENVNVLRRQEFPTKEVMVGDQIMVSLTEIGNFTATAYKITDKGVLFIFDEYVAIRPMNNERTNKGGYDESDLKVWIDTVLLGSFPEELIGRISDLSIPTAGELFGHEDEWANKHFEPDTDEQLLLMKKWRNRTACFNNEYEWGWLRNATNRRFSSAFFAVVNGHGSSAYGDTSHSFGVRPEFWMAR